MFHGEATYVPVFGSSNTIGNYCVLVMDSTITDLASVKDQILTLINSITEKAVKSMMGTGSMAQIMSSILYSLDMIMLGLLGATVFGFVTLALFAYKPFITIVTYFMVFSLCFVFLIGAFMLNGIYWETLIAMYDKDVNC